jgi:hypothetical protein
MFVCSAENWIAKYVTDLLHVLSNNLLGCEMVHLSSTAVTLNQDMQDWVLPVDEIVKCNGSL